MRNGRTGGGRGMYGSSSQVEVDSHGFAWDIEDVTYVYTTVDNFRALVQQLTGSSTASSPRPQTLPGSLTDSDGKLQRQSTLDLIRDPNQEADGGRTLERTLMRNLTPIDIKSPVSESNTLDIYSQQSSGVSSTLVTDHGTTSCSLDLFPTTPTSGFRVSENNTEIELHDHAPPREFEEPKLLQLFPLPSSDH